MSYIKINELSISEDKIVLLDENEKIVLADSGVPPPWNKQGDLHFGLHNIFRLDANGNVVWQVQRNEQGKLYPKDWELRSERRNKNFERKHQGPFARLSTKFIKRGVFNEIEPTLPQYENLVWKPDYVLLAWVYGRGVYELDIETGIAKNVTQPGGRDW